MATKIKADEPRKLPSGKYDKSDPKYYPWIGRKGGKRTVKTQGKSHFSKIASVRHGHINDPAGIASGAPTGDKSARPRKSAGSRAK